MGKSKNTDKYGKFRDFRDKKKQKPKGKRNETFSQDNGPRVEDVDGNNY